MDRINRVDKINAADLKKISPFTSKKKLDNKQINPDARQKNEFFKEHPASADKLNKKISVNMREVLIALENALSHYNQMFDKRNIKLYIFYDITDDNNIVINIADIKSGEYIHRHNICIECIKTENDFLQIIGDFVRDRGILLDVKA